MKTVCLLRHAKSSWDDQSSDDHSRPLNDRGERVARLVAQYLVQKELGPDLVLCSTARRTRETCSHVEGAFEGRLQVAFERDLYLASGEKLLDRLKLLDDIVESVMIIGHNPGLEDLVGLLIDGKGPLASRMAGKFPTAALAVISVAVARWLDIGLKGGKIELFLVPKDLV